MIKKILLLLKLSLTFLLLAFFFRKINFNSFRWISVLESPYKIISLFFLLYLNIFLVSYRLYLISKIVNFKVNLKKCLAINIVGNLFNQVIPSGLGGDIYKIIALKGSALNFKKSFALITSDKLLGLFILTIICLLGLVILRITYHFNNIEIKNLILILGSLYLIIFSMFIYKTSCLRLIKLINPSLFELTSKIYLIFSFLINNVNKYKIFFLSCLIHLISVAVFYVTANILDINLPLISLLIFPSVLLFSSIPITLGGWGLREGLMIKGLSFFSINYSDAFLISLTYGFLVLVSSFPGIFLFRSIFFGKRL
jgi:uncharacterized protein (TIRG00374 family)